MWEEEKRRDNLRDSPVMRNGSDAGAVSPWGLGDEVRKIWADEKRRSNMSSPIMRHAPVTSPVLDRVDTAGGRSLRSVSSRGSIYAAGTDTGTGFGARLSRTTTGSRSVTSPLVPARDVKSPLGGTFRVPDGDKVDADVQSTLDSPMRSPSPTEGRLVVTNPGLLSPISDDGRASSHSNTIMMRKRGGNIARDDSETASRSTSTASKTTLQKAESIFRTFDGVHRNISLNSATDTTASKFGDELYSGISKESKEKSSAQEAAPLDDSVDIPTGFQLPFRPISTNAHNRQSRYSQLSPPLEGMVYYPAPVPRVLNLPMKLSKRASAVAPIPQQFQRQSVFFADARKSAMYNYGPPHQSQPRTRTPDSNAGSDRASNNGSPERLTPGRISPSKQRQSMMSMGMHNAALPPSLRASMYFDGNTQHVPHRVEVKAQSAVLTLESMLNASAQAPAASRDSPNEGISAGKRKSPFERRTVSSIVPGRKDKSQEREDRKSKINYLSLGTWDLEADRKNARDLLEGAEGNKENNASGVSLSDDSPSVTNGPSAIAPWASNVLNSFDRFSVIEEAEAEDASSPPSPSLSSTTSPSPPQPFTAPPNSLLAELATRKAAQRGRNRTAADAFPDGTMSATLLELDAVAEHERDKRVKHRTVLAWETDEVEGADNANHISENWQIEGADDDEVPLALLPVIPPKSPRRKLMQMASAIPGSNVGAQPTTLLGKKLVEDAEPLSARRSRLFGFGGNARSGARSVSSAAQLLSSSGNAGGADTDRPEKGDVTEPENETLAQRTQRLKELRVLKEYLAGDDKLMRGNTVRAIQPSVGGANLNDTGEADSTASFSDEVLALANVPQPVVGKPHVNTDDQVEETLGQRRLRLQQAQQAQPIMHPVLRASPFNPNPKGTVRTVSTTSALGGPGSLRYGYAGPAYGQGYGGGPEYGNMAYSGQGYPGAVVPPMHAPTLLEQADQATGAKMQRRSMMWMQHPGAVNVGVLNGLAAPGAGIGARTENWVANA